MYAARFHASGKDTPYVIAAAARYIHTKAMVAPIVAAMISARPLFSFLLTSLPLGSNRFHQLQDSLSHRLHQRQPGEPQQSHQQSQAFFHKLLRALLFF
jgi:hypothetical protein